MALILGMGNPLLDISDNVTEDTLKKYGLDANNAILAEEKHLPLYKELAAQPGVKYVAGGATQNSIRVAQWMLQQPGATAYMGCVGEDEYSQKMRDACKADGVNALYMVDKSVPTGTCAVCITGNDRSLVANLSAANNYKASHCQESSNWAVVSGAKIIYSAGFFATVSPEAIDLASKEVAKNGAIYCMNLSAPFLMQVPPFKAVFVKTIPYVDFLFGNETEARTWAETEGWDTQDVAFIATRLSLIPSAKGKHRYVVITQGADSTCIAYNGHTTEYPILKLDKSKIVDTNGAGDAYVGGFLAGLAKGKEIKACHEAGAYSASIIIQQSGCVCPGKPTHKL
jgi:adenosine kinase